MPILFKKQPDFFGTGSLPQVDAFDKVTVSGSYFTNGISATKRPGSLYTSNNYLKWFISGPSSSYDSDILIQLLDPTEFNHAAVSGNFETAYFAELIDDYGPNYPEFSVYRAVNGTSEYVGFFDTSPYMYKFFGDGNDEFYSVPVDADFCANSFGEIWFTMEIPPQALYGKQCISIHGLYSKIYIYQNTTLDGDGVPILYMFNTSTNLVEGQMELDQGYPTLINFAKSPKLICDVGGRD